MIKALIVPACTDLNRGDQALVWESVSILAKSFGSVDASIVDYGFTAEDREHQSRQTKDAGYHVVRNIIENPKRILGDYKDGVYLTKFGLVKVACTACFDFFRHFILLFFPHMFICRLLFSGEERVETLKRFRECDVVVVKGGGFLHTYGAIEDLYYIWFGMYHVFLAFRLNKKVIMLPNSIGPIKGRLNRWILKWVLGRIDLLYLREKASLKCLDSMGLNNGKLSIDLGYYASVQVPSGIKAEKITNEGKVKVGITLRPYRFPDSIDPSARYQSYINAISKFCEEHSDSCDFYFVVQVQGPSAHENDRIAINDVVETLSSHVSFHVVDGDYNYRDLIDIYSQLDVVIGTRFHSVIFSHIVKIPAVAIAYGGNKTKGIMNLIGLGQYVLDIESVSALKLRELFQLLQSNRDEYISSLNDFETVCDKSFAKMASEVKAVLR